MSPWKASTSNADYRRRIEMAADYIQSNLSGEVTLEEAARISSFSPYHFHRIFSAILGEPPGSFIQRLRLERAANLLLKNPSLNITEIAFACGFTSSAVFARAFQRHFGVPASRYRRQQSPGSSPAQPPAISPAIQCQLQTLQVQSLPARTLAFAANLQGYSLPHICAAWNRLVRWAGNRGWITPETLAIGISLDDPLITAPARCRYYACITVPEPPPASRDIGSLVLPGGPHAVTRFTCSAEEIQQAYRALYTLWLPQSGLFPGEQPVYEIYHQTPEKHPEQKFVLDLCLPLSQPS